MAEAAHDAFDRWYEAEHLPDAKAAFRTKSACRSWSEPTPGVHLTFYEFPDLSQARKTAASDAIKSLIAEFDRVWQERVQRTREIIELKQTLCARCLCLTHSIKGSIFFRGG